MFCVPVRPTGVAETWGEEGGRWVRSGAERRAASEGAVRKTARGHGTQERSGGGWGVVRKAGVGERGRAGERSKPRRAI